MIAVSEVGKNSIVRHYQLGTPFYRLLWGPHIHHGLWSTGRESVREAQRQLTTTLAQLAHISEGDHVLDVGCGMGGSAIELASTCGCRVTGVTLSPVQRRWAALAAWTRGVSPKTDFLTSDAEELQLEPETVDVVWSIECTEHLFDKRAFIHHSSHWLRDRGRIAITVWFEGPRAQTSAPMRRQCEDVCRRSLCPSLATAEEYMGWMADCGLHVTKSFDWTNRVTRTWEICLQRMQTFRVRSLARLLDQDQVNFIDGFDCLLDAYRNGAMCYGVIVAEKR